MIDGKVAVITGASRGIGRAVAKLFLQEGALLVVNGTREDALASLCAEAEQGRCFACAGDVADPETADRIAETAMARFGRIDILVNNAGINDRTPTSELSREAWLRVMDVNLNGCFYVARAILPHMVQAGSGSMVNMSSAASKMPKPNASVSYGASKAAINAMTRQWAMEFAPYIRVNAVCPGPVLTDMSAQWTEAYRATIAQRIPLGRVGTPEEIARVVLFLAGDGASFITGECVNVNGGSFMD